MIIDEQEFDQFCTFLREVSGISLVPSKRYLITTRIKRILQDNDLASINELMKRMREAHRSSLKHQVIDAMTTNETFWFRDAHPFSYMKSHLLPELLENGKHVSEIRVWCTACSSGQEPYSVAIVADEFQRESYSLNKKPIKILASDISTAMMQAAAEGVYDKVSVLRGLNRERLDRYFQPVEVAKNNAYKNVAAVSNRDKFGLKYNIPNEEINSDANKDRGQVELDRSERWQVKPAIKEKVEFRTHNLLDSYAGLGRFDIIFCRNVLIYFSADIKQATLKRLHNVLNPGGYLFLGSSEGLGESAALFDMVQCNPGIVYRARQV